MANTNDPVSVPAVKPEAPAAQNTGEAVPAAVTEAVSAAVKTGWMAGKGKLGMVVGGSLLTLVGGAYGVKLIGAGSPKAAAQQQVAEKKSSFEAPAKPEADEPRKLSKGITDLPATELPPVAATRVETVGGETARPKSPVKPTVDVEIPDLKAPPIPTGAIDITPPDVKIPAKPVIQPGKNEPAELPSNNKNTVVQPIEQPIIRVGAQEGKDKTETPAPPKAPKIDLDPLPEVSAPKIGGATPAPAPAPGNLNLEIPAPPPVSAPPKLPEVVAPPAGITEPKPASPGVIEPKAPGIAEPKISAPGTGATKPGSATGPAPADLPSPKNLLVEPPPKIDVPTINPGVGPAPKTPGAPEVKAPGAPEVKAPGAPEVKAPGTPDLVIPSAPKIETPDLRGAAPITETPPKTPGIGIEPAPLPGNNPKPPAPAVKREDYDEDWHTLKAGDDYAMISREYYKSAEYARALEAYNKDRRRGNEDIVRVPPLWVLEDKFPGLIGSGKSETKTPPGGTGKTTGLSFEPVEGRQIGTSAQPSRPAPNAAISPVSNTNDEYRVRGEGGEQIRDIARKIYGDAKAWKRIYDLNPSIDPTEPIPAGTTLRLPR